MEEITFEIKSLLKLKLDLVEYPELSSKKKWVRKGINILKQYTPGVLSYLSKENILARLKEYNIVLKTEKKTTNKRAKLFFKIWLNKEKAKRLFLIILEALIIPFTGILALLPGPNFFFYVPALLFYYHFASYRSLRKIDVDELQIEIVRY
ncbi:MAG: hypothetical protein KAT34_05280 [Candidatus Aminicenantes bacterium]|nr:hypothetical protein [Candidatus Aminicenantes bacterium]